MTLLEAGNRLAEVVEARWGCTCEKCEEAREEALAAWREAVAQQEDDGK